MNPDLFSLNTVSFEFFRDGIGNIQCYQTLYICKPNINKHSVPMKNDSTHLIHSSSSDMNHTCLHGRRSSAATPRRMTLAAIRQFARAYTCAATLPPSLGCFVAN